MNKSVPNTVDLRALTKISSSSSEDQKREALKENMTLALESARAIGCRVSDDSGDNILNRHPQTIRDFLVDLIRVSGQSHKACILKLVMIFLMLTNAGKGSESSWHGR